LLLKPVYLVVFAIAIYVVAKIIDVLGSAEALWLGGGKWPSCHHVVILSIFVELRN
jgi:hypothetical protein